MLTVINEFTRVCLAIAVARRLNSDDVLRYLTELFVRHVNDAERLSRDLIMRDLPNHTILIRREFEECKYA